MKSATTTVIPWDEVCNTKIGIKEYFGTQIISREQWSFLLGINRCTLYRWERIIVEADRKIDLIYYDGSKRKGKDGLDGYQRFFIAFIQILKSGLVTLSPMTNQEVIDYLLEKDGGNVSRIINFSRFKFQNWINQGE